MSRIFKVSFALMPIVILSGCSAFGGDDKPNPQKELAPAQVTSIGVNSYLWRAALDTISFMPLLSADPSSGVIITDWYVNPASPAERMKLTVMVLDTNLRSDALRVSAARQIAQNGQWMDAPVQAATVQKLENIILSRARDLRRGASID